MSKSDGRKNTLSVPENGPYLKTADGLKYWLVNHGSTIGPLNSVISENPLVSMHSYTGAGPGGPYGSYLFRYNGTEIGFVTHGVDDNGTPFLDNRRADPVDVENRISCTLIRAIGTPVYDASHRYQRDERTGKLRKDLAGRFVLKKFAGTNKPDYSAAWVTKLGWEQYKKGGRDKFPSREVQDEMISLWPPLFNGLINELRELSADYRNTLPDGTPAWRPRMRFSENVLQEFKSGALIDDAG